MAVCFRCAVCPSKMTSFITEMPSYASYTYIIIFILTHYCQNVILFSLICKCQAFFTIFSQYFYCILVYYKCSLLCDLKPVFCWYCSKIHIELQHKKTGICQSFKNYYSIAFIQINSFISSRYNCLDDL